MLLLLALCFGWLTASAQNPDPRIAEFKALAGQVAEQRLSGAEEEGQLQERALALLDQLVLEVLNRGPAQDIAALNRRLSSLVAQEPPVGESYQVVPLGSPPRGLGYFALVANFSLSGPGAVRVYAPAGGHYTLAGRVDRLAQPEFFDEYLELVPVKASEIVFVTVAGRTDEFRTGSFAAWRLTPNGLHSVWSAELLEHSTYELRPDGFHLWYCGEPDPQDRRRCARMLHDRYLWDGVAWKLAAREPAAPRP
jgi:hypothetical protein